MKSKQFAVLVVVAFIGGIGGGFVSNQVGSIGQAFAKPGDDTIEKIKAKVIEAKIVEANEFRVVDKNGKILASFGPADKNGKQYAELSIKDDKGNVLWSAP